MLKKEKRKISFRVEIYVEKDGDAFYAYCPVLKGVHVDGNTEMEAVENAKTAIILYIRSLIKHGDPIPIQITKIDPMQNKVERSFATYPIQKVENIYLTI